MIDIKLLPLDQPYASLIALGAKWDFVFKEFETRPRSNAPGKDYRGWVAIHANAKQTNYHGLLVAITSHLKEIGKRRLAKNLEEYFFFNQQPTGAIVALAKVAGAFVMESHPKLGAYYQEKGEISITLYAQDRQDAIIIETVSKLEQLTGDWQEGRWAFRLADVIALDRPIPFKGQQGAPQIKDIEVLAKLNEAIARVPVAT